MADYVQATVDLSPVLRAIDTVNRNVDIVNRNIAVVDQNLERVRRQTMNEIDLIKKQLKEMERQAKLTAAYQAALTEIVRVRQELEAKFGTHKQVRAYMLGILQATDLGLITKNTISKCTEELMISAPKYWLAPALIALAAWISDNKSLANRAVQEAFARNKEKTCLLFALITRRVSAGRAQGGKEPTDATFKWLNLYFSFQDPRKMKKSIIAYVDAYANGVFGYDKDNICRDHINHWMDELISENTNFGEEQKAYWLNFFQSKCYESQDESFVALKEICPQYPQINNYVSRIGASESEDGIKHYFKEIVNTEVDKKKLIADIDDQLMKLVERYDEDEEPLRDEETYLELVKKHKGDEEKAHIEMDAIYLSRRKDQPVDFAQRLRESITGGEADISAKKTALMLMGGYISNAFNEFVTATKGEYPQVIDLTIVEPGKVTGNVGTSFSFVAQTENGENREELIAELSRQYNDAKKKTLDSITDEEAEKTKKTGIVLCCLFFLALIPLFIGISKLSKAKKMRKANEDLREAVNRYYDTQKNRNIDKLNKALDARAIANKTVEDFLANEAENEVIVL